MGIQGTNMGDVTGASVLVIEQACENSQLLVSLCRNGNQWLSPVGWTEKQKITLLDCRSQGGKTEVEIPAEYSKILTAGDTLTLTCSELDLTQDIIWEGSNLLTRSIADHKPSNNTGLSSGLTGGFLSRFKSSKAPEILDTRSEAERRAEEADRAAETYRAKMEVATQAKEEAQAKALAAAKEAEAALKMEAERITEMERAAKAFEEAERLKQDGKRRVEEERRQEEARKAEDARRIEDARKREEAERAEAERKAALERYEAALDVTQNEEMRLQNRLSRLKADASNGERQKSEQVETLSALRDDLLLVESKTDTAREAFEKAASKLDRLRHDLTDYQAKSDNLNAECEEINHRVSQADSEYLTAQKEAEMAMARAEERRNVLDAARAEKDTVSERLNALTGTLETQAKLVSDTTMTSQKLQSKYEAAQAELNNKSMNIEALQSNAERIFESVQTSRLEIEATQQAVEDCRIRQAAHQNAIQHLGSGGNPESMPVFDPEVRFFSNEASDISSDTINFDDINAEEKSKGLFGRVRQSLARSKDPEISVELEDVSLDDVTNAAEAVAKEALKIDDVQASFSIEDIIVEPEPKTAGFARRHSKSLLAIGTILGGAAILGGGYLATQNGQPQTLTVKSSYPVSSPTTATIASLAVDVKTPVSKATLEVPVSKPVAELPSLAFQNTEVGVDEMVIPDIPLPNLTLTGKSLDKAPAKKLLVKTVSVKPIQPQKTVTAKAKAPKNYLVLTKRVQTQLQTLGFYSGKLNGLQTAETKAAIKTFQELYSLPQSGLISGKFLTSLTNAEAQHKQAQKNAVMTDVVPKVESVSSNADTVQFAETSFSAPVFYDAVTSVPTETVTTDELPIVQSYSAPDVTYQEATAPLVTTPAPTPAVESAPAITQVQPSQLVPPVQDVIVEAVRTRSASASYPRAAAAKNYFIDARIVVAYDIDVTGSVINPRIVSNDHTGRYNTAFENSAIKAVKKQKFSPKTINGQAVASTGQTQRIVFKAG